MLKIVFKYTGIVLISITAFITLFIFFSFLNVKEMAAKEFPETQQTTSNR